MMVYKILPFILWLFVLLHNGKCSIRTFRYKSFSCSDTVVLETIINSTVRRLGSRRNQLDCAVASGTGCQAGRCRYAVYRKQNSECLLVDDYQVQNKINSNSDIRDFVNEDGCLVLEPACNNGGVKKNILCDCPKEFAGQYCDIDNPPSCQKITWTLVNERDYPILETSKSPAKIISDSQVLIVTSMKLFNNTGKPKFVVQANEYFDWNDSDPVNPAPPFQKLFLLRDMYAATPVHRIARLNPGGTIEFSSVNSNFKLYTSLDLKRDSTVYWAQNGANWSDVAKALSQGYRVLERNPTRFEFSTSKDAKNQVSYHTYQTRISTDNYAEEVDWLRPLTYRSSQNYVQLNTRNIVEYSVGLPESIRAFSRTPETSTTSLCEMDKCWTKVGPSKNQKEHLSLLREFAREGKEQRVVLNGYISSDVIGIHVYPNDLIVQLAVYVKSVGGYSPPVYDIMMSVVSLSKTIINCVIEAEYRNNGWHRSSQLTSLLWFVTTRKWTKVLSVNRAGIALYGNKTVLYEGAAQGANVRICLNYADPDSLVCTGVKAIDIKANDRFIFQTGEMVLPLTSNGVFQGLHGPGCITVIRILSAEGWVTRPLFKAWDTVDSYDWVGSITHFDWFLEE